jgi:glutamyl-Q tRNA(Asp) synthetase
MHYTGRFAPSPTGPLHEGSLVAAMASYLDARAHQGRWLLRIEDIDEPRTVTGAAENIFDTLALLGMHPDSEVIWQSQRKSRYAAALVQLDEHVYPCGCSRREIADSRTGIASDGAAIYPGTCRHGLAEGKSSRAWRLRVPPPISATGVITFEDRWLGRITENLAESTGDFVLKRADGFWAYQLAVVVDDADQGVTDVVRGADLLGSTARQIYLQRLLQLPTPRYMHVPVVNNDEGEKLSKQNGATSLNLNKPLDTLMLAASRLGLVLPATAASGMASFWDAAISTWARRFMSE